MTEKRLPNLVIAGVVKGGTTSLYSYLCEHPDVCCSTVKETCYFSMYRYGQIDSRYENAAVPFDQFQDYFCHCRQEKYVMEATPGYFEGGADVANSIKKTLGKDTKVLIILRDPVDRLVSFWKYKKSMVELDDYLSLEGYIQQCQAMPYECLIKQENDRYWGIEGGYYANYLTDWFEVFGDSLKVSFFDDLKADSKAFLEETCQWLELDTTFIETLDFTIQNKSIRYKNARMQKLALYINSRAEKFWRSHQKIKSIFREVYYTLNGQTYEDSVNEETLSRIRAIYRPHNQRLAKHLNDYGYDSLPSWLQIE